MPSQKKVSFIIPVYNGEKYLRRCIDSLLSQENFDTNSIEILLLDDGSTDSSFDILNIYQNENPNIIRCFKHKNMGVARTRNKGIDLVKGEYLAFIDQDDFVDTDFCYILYTAAYEGKFDVVFSGMKRPDQYGKIKLRTTYKNTEYARLMCMSIWAKLHKTEFVRKHNIRLFDSKQGEDIAFTFEEYQKTDKMLGLSYCGYNWFYNSESVSNTSQRKLNESNVNAIIRLQDRLFELDAKHDDMTTFFITMLSCYYVFFSGKGSSRDQFIKGESLIMNNLRQHRPNFSKNRYLLRAPSGILPLFSIGTKCYMILSKLNLMKFFANYFCKGGAL